MSEQERFDRDRAGSNEAERAGSNEVEAHRAGQRAGSNEAERAGSNDVEAHRAGQRAGSHSEEPTDDMDRNAPQNDEGDEVEGHVSRARASNQRPGI